jgi:hypothetical protein
MQLDHKVQRLEWRTPNLIVIVGKTKKVHLVLFLTIEEHQMQIMAVMAEWWAVVGMI